MYRRLPWGLTDIGATKKNQRHSGISSRAYVDVIIAEFTRVRYGSSLIQQGFCGHFYLTVLHAAIFWH